jgi:Mre11 DNA-binding presumed domain
LQIQGKEFQLTPLPLRTVRPFIIEDIVLSDIADEVGLDLNDQMAITKFLKGKVSLFSYLKIKRLANRLITFYQVNTLIEQANKLWDERNAKAAEDGEPELPRMLPLVRLKVYSVPFLKVVLKKVYMLSLYRWTQQALQKPPIQFASDKNSKAVLPTLVIFSSSIVPKNLPVKK